jgi:hypothetical protein
MWAPYNFLVIGGNWYAMHPTEGFVTGALHEDDGPDWSDRWAVPEDLMGDEMGMVKQTLTRLMSV